MDIDSAINDVERLYRSVTGGMEPSVKHRGVIIPPEKDPQQFINEQVGRLNDLLGQSATPPMPTWAPAVDVWETEEEYIVRADLPGVTRQSLRSRMAGQEFIIEGTREPGMAETSSPSVVRRWGEQAQGRFERRIVLPPDGTGGKQLKGRLQGGVLEVRVPKRPVLTDAPTTHTEIEVVA